MRIKRAIVAAILVMAPLSAHAVVITWTLNNFIFDDAGVASGSFEWDTDTASVASWDISVAGGNTATFPALTYSDDTGLLQIIDSGSAYNLIFSERIFPRPRRTFRLAVATSDLLGMPVSFLDLVASDFVGPDGFLECYRLCSPIRRGDLSAGPYLSAAVPEPGTLVLAGLGIAGMMLQRRKA